MSEHWKVKKLGDVCNFQGGSQPPKSTFSTICKDNYVRLIQIRDYKSDNHIVFIPKDKARRFCTEEDVMIGRYGPPVFQILRGLEGAYNVALMKATPDESQLLKDFLFYFLKTPNVQNYIINLSARAAGQTGLNKATIEPYLIPLPPLSEQKRIVTILEEAFEGIDRAIAIAEKNLTNARELFESYLNAIFTQKGDGWVEKKLEDICKEITVGHVGSMASKYKDIGIPFLRSQNILPFRIKLDNVVFIDDEFHAALKKSQLRPGDLAIVRTGYPGTAAVIPEELEIVNCSDLVIVKPGENINPHYLCIFFNSVFGKTLVGSRLVGAAQKHFNITTAKKVLIPFPCLTKQNFFVTKMDELAVETQRLEAIYRQKIAALKELKQSILQKAFTGELTADTVEKAA